MSRITFVLALLLMSSAVAHAEVQTNVQESWPGKVMFGARPLGVEIGFTDAYVGRNGTGYVYGVGDRIEYKLALDVAGIIANLPKVTIWLGGEFNVGGRAYLAAIEPGIFVQFTLEKLLNIPLVPMVRAGLSGPAYFPYGYTASAAGAFELKVGAGVYYFLTKRIGVGADTNFAFGPGFININGVINTGFAGYWDFLVGARFAL